MHILKDFKPKIPAKFHSNSLLKKCYFFLFILHNKYSGKNMPCEAGGVPSCKKYQIASDTRFAGYLFEALKSYAINLIRWKRKYNKQGGVGR